MRIDIDCPERQRRVAARHGDDGGGCTAGEEAVADTVDISEEARARASPGLCGAAPRPSERRALEMMAQYERLGRRHPPRAVSSTTGRRGPVTLEGTASVVEAPDVDGPAGKAGGVPVKAGAGEA